MFWVDLDSAPPHLSNIQKPRPIRVKFSFEFYLYFPDFEKELDKETRMKLKPKQLKLPHDQDNHFPEMNLHHHHHHLQKKNLLPLQEDPEQEASRAEELCCTEIDKRYKVRIAEGRN